MQERSKQIEVDGLAETDLTVQRRSAVPGKRQMCAACHGVTENIVQWMAGEQGAAAVLMEVQGLKFGAHYVNPVGIRTCQSRYGRSLSP